MTLASWKPEVLASWALCFSCFKSFKTTKDFVSRRVLSTIAGTVKALCAMRALSNSGCIEHSRIMLKQPCDDWNTLIYHVPASKGQRHARWSAGCSLGAFTVEKKLWDVTQIDNGFCRSKVSSSLSARRTTQLLHSSEIFDTEVKTADICTLGGSLATPRLQAIKRVYRIWLKYRKPLAYRSEGIKRATGAARKLSELGHARGHRSTSWCALARKHFEKRSDQTER